MSPAEFASPPALKTRLWVARILRAGASGPSCNVVRNNLPGCGRRRMD